MDMIILAITIVAVAGGVAYVLRTLASLSREEKERQRLLQVGQPAHARILQVSMGGMTITTGVHRQLQVHLSVEVQRPGTPPYPAQITTLVSELHIPQVQPGAWLAVRIDPASPQSMAIEALGVPAPGSAPPAGPGAGGYPFRMGTPATGFQIPTSAKIGIAVALLGAAVGIGGAVMGSMNHITGPSDACKRATACCKKVTGSSPACDNFVKVSDDTVCENAAKGYCR